MGIEKIIRAAFKERVHINGFEHSVLTSERVEFSLNDAGSWLTVRWVETGETAKVPRENISFLKVLEIESPAAKPAVGSSRRSRRKSK